jgi:predicted nucleic acid-binding protein
MIYLDTSFLTPLFREEATSAKVAEFLSRQAAGTLAVSKWASVEFASLISRDVRMGALTVGQGRKLIAEFDSMISASLVVLIPSANDFDLAQEYVANFSTQLRGPDALHLAVAHSNGMEFIATLDNGMLSAAKRLKILARRVIRQLS